MIDATDLPERIKRDVLLTLYLMGYALSIVEREEIRREMLTAYVSERVKELRNVLHVEGDFEVRTPWATFRISGTSASMRR